MCSSRYVRVPKRWRRRAVSSLRGHPLRHERGADPFVQHTRSLWEQSNAADSPRVCGGRSPPKVRDSSPSAWLVPSCGCDEQNTSLSTPIPETSGKPDDLYVASFLEPVLPQSRAHDSELRSISLTAPHCPPPSAVRATLSCVWPGRRPKHRTRRAYSSESSIVSNERSATIAGMLTWTWTLCDRLGAPARK